MFDFGRNGVIRGNNKHIKCSKTANFQKTSATTPDYVFSMGKMSAMDFDLIDLYTMVKKIYDVITNPQEVIADVFSKFLTDFSVTVTEE